MNSGAAPTVQVRGQAVLRMMAVEHRAGGLVLGGELLDSSLLTGLPARQVTVTVRSADHTYIRVATTDRWGKFQVLLPPLRGTIGVAPRFVGDALYAAHEPLPRAVDVARTTLDIGLDPPPGELDAGVPIQEVAVLVRTAGQPVQVPLELFNAAGELLVRATSDGSGRARVKLPTRKLGRPGPVTLVVRFAGDSGINPATRRFEALLVAPVALTLRARSLDVASDGELALDGQLSDSTGPMAGAAVSLHVLGEYAGTAVSDQQGRYSISLPAADFPAGVLDLEARHSPAVVWRRPARSPAVEVTVRPPRPISPVFYLFPALITALILVALLLLRNWHHLRRLARWLVPRLESRPSASRQPAGEQPTRSGVRLARRSLRSMITQDFAISGEVWDATDRVLVVGARVEISSAGMPPQVLGTGDSGCFRSGDLPEGSYGVSVSRQGYVSEHFTITLPHRGSLHGIRIDLVQVRVRLLEIYQRTAGPLLPRKELWGCWTPRELMRHVHRGSGRRFRHLELLTRILEAGYWGQDPPPESLVHQAYELVQSHKQPGADQSA